MKQTGSIGVILLVIAGCSHATNHPAKWMLQVYEPAEHGGFGTPYKTKAECEQALKYWIDEAERFRADGHGDEAPTARCFKAPQ